MLKRATLLACVVGAGCGKADDDSAPANRTSELERRLEAAEARIAALEAELERRPDAAPVPVLELPKANKVVGRRVAIVVTQSEILVDDEAVAMVALRAHLEIILASRPDVTVVLRADPDVEFPRVTDVMDVVKEAGISRISVAVYSDE